MFHKSVNERNIYIVFSPNLYSMSEDPIILSDKCSINSQPPGLTVYLGGKYAKEILKVMPLSVDSKSPMYLMQFNKTDKTITIGIAKL